MLALEHRVRVFVFQFLGSEIRYLLLRQRPTVEWPPGPVIGSIGVDEHMRDAIVREVREDTGIRGPHHIIDLSTPSKELFGDVGLVEWPFAYQAGNSVQPLEVTPGPKVGEFAWMGFAEAFQSVENQTDRDALVRLRLDLQG